MDSNKRPRAHDLNVRLTKPVHLGAQTGRWGDDCEEWETHEEEGISLIERCDTNLLEKRCFGVLNIGRSAYGIRIRANI